MFTEEEYDYSKQRELLKMKCDFCNSIFNRTKKLIYVGRHKNPKSKHVCNIHCTGKLKSLNKSQNFNCLICDKIIIRRNSEIEKSKHKMFFCGHKCCGIYTSQNRKNGTNVSKLEKWLQKNIINRYNSLTFSFNKTNAINAELDVYIQSLDLAFELNGVFHYKPIFGMNKLQKTKKNDDLKIEKCLEHKLFLYVIDITNQIRFTPKTGDLYLDVIANVIDYHIKRKTI